MKSKAISVILSMILAGSLGVGQNITIIEDHTTEDHTIAEDREAGCVTIEALFLGDICLGTGFGSKHRFQDVYNEKGAEYFFSGVREEFRDKDLIVANLENVFTDNKDYQKGKIYTYRADPKYIDIIKKSGITYLGVVNNHMGDYLQSGFDDSIKNLDAEGIKWFGTNEIKSNSVELGDIIVDKKEVYEKDGFKIGLLAYNGFYESYATDSMIKRDIEYFRNIGVDYIVALVHWGGQNTHDITPRQKSYGRHLIDMGVDLIIGGHPHAVQEIETYKGKRIYYSLGDFLFVERKVPKCADSLMVQLKLTKTLDGVITEEFKNIPAFWGGNKIENTFRPVANKDKEDIERVHKLIKQ
ncbi:MAG: CapA family protein [Natronincolaceae bacterium]|jgi:poly-gamma-glutamate synthesis protein (capsule biosynthesis protein)|nr:CapA family protein [Clostridiales bacterium]